MCAELLARHQLADRFASRTDVFEESIWTNILNQFKKHDDPVYFGDGAPAPELIPVERMQHALGQAFAEGPAAFGYGDQQGYLPLRELIADRVGRRGITASVNDILVTSGSTQAIDLACRTFFEPGDAVIVEHPTFLGALEIFELAQVEIISVDMDDDGMRMDALQQALEMHPHVKAVYTIPTFHNPTGATLPLDRRQRMVDLAREHNVVILEDDPYGELHYRGESVAPLRALDDQVVYLGTFSKTIAPGIRVGFAIAPGDVLARMLAIREVTDISNDRLTMRLVYYTARDFLDNHVERARDAYRSRLDAMLAALDEQMPASVTWSRPDGGFFVWITLPDSLDAQAFEDAAAKNGAIVFPGAWFYADKRGANTVRLSFSTVPEDRIRLGISRLGETLRECGI